MSGPESLKPDDRLLEEFLAGEGAVRAAYHETASARPPPALDAAILQLAASAKAPVMMRRAARPRWQLPMATAAVLMLSLGVLLQVQRDPAVQQQLMASPDQATPAASAPAEVVADAALPEVLVVTKPALDEAAVEKKQTAVAAASPKPARPAEKRATESPPPPPVMAEVLPAAAPAPPQPAATADAPVAEEESLERAAVLGAMAQESMQRRERSAASVAKAQANRSMAPAAAFAASAEPMPQAMADAQSSSLLAACPALQAGQLPAIASEAAAITVARLLLVQRFGAEVIASYEPKRRALVG